jgi:hypothetical protein
MQMIRLTVSKQSPGRQAHSPREVVAAWQVALRSVSTGGVEHVTAPSIESSRIELVVFVHESACRTTTWEQTGYPQLNVVAC